MNSASVIYKQFLQETAARTGKSAEQWKSLLQTHGFTRHSDRMKWLQGEHKLPYRTAYLLASHADELRPDYRDEAGLLETMYIGKEKLRPVHDSLTELAMMLGNDVSTSIGKTMVTFRRKHVFAQIKPTTKTRIDFGLALPALEHAPPSLIPTGGIQKGDRISYRIAIASEEDVDHELQQWLEQAYNFTAAG